MGGYDMARPIKKANAKGTVQPGAAPDAEAIRKRKRRVAEVCLSSSVHNLITTLGFKDSACTEKTDLLEANSVMRVSLDKLKSSDLTGVKEMLLSQAQTLDAIFTELGRRGSQNINDGRFMNAAEIYLKLAFKAQSQCRCTLEALAEIVNPRPVAFVKQANIANQQQVNNGTAQPVTDSRTREIANQSNELLPGVINGQRMDTRAPETAGRANQELEAVGQVNGAKDA